MLPKCAMKKEKLRVDCPVLCVTLNPSWEVLHAVPGWRQKSLARVQEARLMPGGKGINVARALQLLGDRSMSTGLLGRATHREFRVAMDRAGLPGRWYLVPGSPRVNVTIYDPALPDELHTIGPGPEVSAGAWNGFVNLFRTLVPPDGLVALCGSAPPGISPDQVAELLNITRRHRARMVVDASGALLGRLLEEMPWGVKVNRDELASVLGWGEAGADELIREVTKRYGEVEWIIVTDGHWPAWLVWRGRFWSATPPEVPAARTVGCGDAFLAGVLHSLRAGHTLPEAFASGIAAGSAAAHSPLPGLFDRSVYEQYFTSLVSQVTGR